MGQNNQQRRAAKKRARQTRARRPQPGTGAGRPGGGRADPGALDSLAWVAAHLDVGPERTAHLLEMQRAGQPAADAVTRQLVQATGEVWALGYSPADVLHLVTRTGSPAHVAIAATGVLSDPVVRGHATRSDRWAAQLQDVSDRGIAARVRPDALEVAVAVVSFLLLLERIPAALRLPGVAERTTDSSLDSRVLTRVRALLRKAESTNFEEEADALTAKAQQLISRHAIDQTRLHVDEPQSAVGPGIRRLLLDDPYMDVKALLVSQVASANRCRAAYAVDAGWCTVFGFDADLDAVELLVSSLLAQALRAQARHGPQRDALGRSRTRSFRRAFLQAFAVRVGDRLKAADAGVVDAASDRDRLMPVLQRREGQVEAALDAAFPHTVDKTLGGRLNSAGWAAGTIAADLASLDTTAGALGRPD